MPTATYTPIASTTLGSAAASVTFDNLNVSAAGMRDLIVVVDAKIAASVDIVLARINGVTTSSYSSVHMEGDGTIATSFSQTETAFYTAVNDYNLSPTTPSTNILYFFDIAQTDKHKTILSRTNMAVTSGGTFAAAGRFASTNAITSITLLTLAQNYSAGSTFSLYGVIA